MKKFIISFFIIFFLSFSINTVSTMAQVLELKEGFYKIDSISLTADKNYTVQNNSFSDRAFVLIFDANQVIQQAIRLKPQSPKFSLIPLRNDYKIVVVGEGSVTIS